MPNSLKDLDKAVCQVGSDDAVFFGGTWTGGYYIQQDPKEFAQLVQLLQGFRFDNYLAIGIATGGVERFICENVDVRSLCVIDNGKHPQFSKWRTNKLAIDTLTGGVESFIGDSHSKAAERFIWNECDELSMKFNLVGIDGDHSPQGVLQDWEMVTPYLAPGCLVWFHDLKIGIPGQHGARKLWARLKTQYEVLLETNGKFGIGVIRVS